MNSFPYSYGKQVSLSFDDALKQTKALLKDEGFGLLMEIDVQEKMKEKLQKSMDKYVILGACNPPLAFGALQAEIEVGLLLPCNVIVYENSGKTYVSSVLPTVMMDKVENSRLNCVSKEVEPKLKNVIDNLPEQ